jgi:hypothetical protein
MTVSAASLARPLLKLGGESSAYREWLMLQ